MGQFILKLDGKYLLWSTIVDAPVSYGMTLEELTEHVREEEGRRGVEELQERLARVEKTGCSSRRGETAEQCVAFNRAGAGETCLSVEQIVAYYVNYADGMEQPRGRVLKDE